MIKSISESSYIKEIIVVENASSEAKKTEKIINQLKSKISYIKYIKSKTNIGFSKACNLGVKKSRYPYILFINPDTVVKKNSITTLMEHLVNKSADIAGGKMVKKNGEIHKSFVREPNLCVALFEFSNLGKILKLKTGHNHFYYENNNFKSDVIVDAVSGGFLLTKRAVYDKLGGFDERFFMYLEDVDFGVRANNGGYKVIYCPHSEIFHEGGASSDNIYRIRHSSWFESRKKYCLKHFTITENILIQPIYMLEEVLLRLLRLLWQST